MVRNKHTLVRSILFSLALCLGSVAYADLLVSPTRVLMNDDNRSATLTLRNNSSGSRSYRLSWQDKHSNSDGRYTIIPENEQWPSSAKDMIRHSPRQITVGPNENQTVRFNWRPPADLPSGEYRSHILLEVIPDVSEPTATLEAKTGKDDVGIQVFMQMSFSIPVIVRHTTDAPKVSISNIEPVQTTDKEHIALKITFNRDGKASSYGRVVVEMQRNSDSPVEKIGEYRELTIFHEMDKRDLTIPLRDAVIPEGAWVRVSYEGLKEYEGILWAEKVFQAK